MTERSLRLEQFTRALGRLDEALALRSDESMWRDALIQRFEFTFELAWKALQDAVAHEVSERPGTARQTFRAAWQAGYLSDEETWVAMLQDRNITSHTYRDDLAREVADRIVIHASVLRRLHATLLQLAAQ